MCILGIKEIEKDEEIFKYFWKNYFEGYKYFDWIWLDIISQVWSPPKRLPKKMMVPCPKQLAEK
jgi:hypothetical protein